MPLLLAGNDVEKWPRPQLKDIDKLCQKAIEEENWQGDRNAAVIAMIGAFGKRANENARLRKSDLRLEDKTLFVEFHVSKTMLPQAKKCPNCGRRCKMTWNTCPSCSPPVDISNRDMVEIIEAKRENVRATKMRPMTYPLVRYVARWYEKVPDEAWLFPPSTCKGIQGLGEPNWDRHMVRSNVWAIVKKYADNWWPHLLRHCALPGQDIFGGSPIEDAKVGETIYNGFGEATKVTDTFTKHYDGNIITILPRGMRLPVKVTPEHFVWALRGVKAVRHPLPSDITIADSSWVCNERPEWIRAGDLKIGDWVGFPLLKPFFIENQTVSIPRTWDRLRKKFDKQSPVPEIVPVTTDLAYLMGLYFAEGSTVVREEPGAQISFSYGSHERVLADTTMRLLKDIFSVNSKLYLGGPKNCNGIAVRAYASPLGRALKKWFGDKARTKKVPDWIMKSRPDIWASFLRGAFEGDGYVSRMSSRTEKKAPYYGMSISTKEGALQIFALLVSLGIRPRFTPVIQKTPFTCEEGNMFYKIAVASDFNKLARLFAEPPRLGTYEPRHHTFFYKEHLWMKVEEASTSHYEGPVYDLAVSDRNSYIIEGIAVHNSLATKFAERTDEFHLLDWFDWTRYDTARKYIKLGGGKRVKEMGRMNV